jgi:Putative phage abortive infection protein
MSIARKSVFWGRPVGLLITVLVVGVFWFSWAYFLPKLILSCAWLQTPGQFGEMFGGLSTLFAGLAFAVLLHALFVQWAELKSTQAEVEEGRNQGRLRRFEDTFFQLLRTFNVIVESMEQLQYRQQGAQHVAIKGRNLLFADAQRLLTNINEQHRRFPEKPRATVINDAYEEFYLTAETHLAHYFRMLYRILRWVDTADVPEKSFYAKTLRAQLSSQELILILYNCGLERGAKMKPLVERYAMLKHIIGDNIVPRVDKDRFAATAFADVATVDSSGVRTEGVGS